MICLTGLFLFYAARAYSDEDNSNEADRLFGETDPFLYLTGKFNPEKHPLFCNVDAKKIPVKRSGHILRREAAEALTRMYEDFRKAHPETPFWVQSSTRNFFDQKMIWDKKWKGKGADPKDEKEIMKRGLSILTYSSMPGTSRHHWGTEVDLNVLRNDYFEKGPGAVLYAWLAQNAHRYGFCQPYGAGRAKGYAEEKWHWSYRPLSAAFLMKWNELYETRKSFFTQNGQFSGSSLLGVLAPVYVNGISGDCR